MKAGFVVDALLNQSYTNLHMKRIVKITSHHPAHIVCLGASAGGLEALIAVLKLLPQDINMAFVLIQHLEPHHKSALTEILSREISLDISQAKNNIKIESAHVYVIPPNALMSIEGERLKIILRTKRTDGKYLPIDFFMNSLAKTAKEKAIGIILSGTGTDGTIGAKAIKANGGIIFAQNEETSHYFGMPSSVIASRVVDFILSPKEIARKLINLRASGSMHSFKKQNKNFIENNSLKQILILLRDLTGMDFLHYKQTTVVRRIAHRMAFHNFKNQTDYYDYLKANPGEADFLRKDILISVTSFFRDPKIFTVLRKKVFPLMIKKCSLQNPLRLWVPACSSGEEVYSLAISLYEFLEERKIKPFMQVFGTDLSELNINKARLGLYSQDICAHVSAQRLRRFFTKTDSGYKISKQLREFCIFAKHDITSDPPLSNMDIASCRNLLIYLDATLQSKALLMLHYALKPNGFLILGTAESVETVPRFFTAFEKNAKIYTKNFVARKASLEVETLAGRLKTTKIRQVSLSKEKVVKKIKMPKSSIVKKSRFEKTNMINTQNNIVSLKKEFLRTVERLNVISNEKDTFNEELKAANEEIQSSNEELQSMNEELETSKEELQSTNEELLTLNEELQNKNVELTNLNSDMNNVFASTNIPIIIVGNDLCIKRFTPTARKVMNLIPTDIGRPISDIKLNIAINKLEEIILEVVDEMVMKEFEVRDKVGRWYSVRIRPYRTTENKIDGAIIALIDIDVVKRSQDEVQNAFKYAEAIIETMREPLVVLNKDIHIVSANKSFCEIFKVQIDQIKEKVLFELCGHQFDTPVLRKLLKEVLPKKNYFNDVELIFNFSLSEQKIFIFNGRQIKLQGKDSPLILLAMEDVTKRKNAEDVLKRDNKILDKMVNKRSKELIKLQLELVRSKHLSAVGTLAATVAHELRNPLADIALSTHRIKKINDDLRIEKILTHMSARVSESDHIINNILAYSKTSISHYVRTNINEVIRESIDEEMRNFISESIEVHQKIDATQDLFMRIDPVRIKEVFRNIIHNSLDAVDKHTGILEIKSQIDRAELCVFIIDNGEGIAKKDLKRVISPFFTTKAKGTGLGLAVCQQILTLHGGSLIIRSIRGKGTSVQVKLPIEKD